MEIQTLSFRGIGTCVYSPPSKISSVFPPQLESPLDPPFPARPQRVEGAVIVLIEQVAFEMENNRLHDLCTQEFIRSLCRILPANDTPGCVGFALTV